jgi:hypothetical protein
MTLNEMILETCSLISEELTLENGVYLETEITYPIISSLNYSYRQICKDKLLLDTKDTLVSGDFLTLPCIKVYKVQDSAGNQIPFTIENNKIIFDYDQQVDVYYYYYPEKLVNLTDVPLVPEEQVDHRVFCLYAASDYLTIQGDEIAKNFLDMYKASYDEIKLNRIKQTVVKRVVY